MTVDNRETQLNTTALIAPTMGDAFVVEVSGRAKSLNYPTSVIKGSKGVNVNYLKVGIDPSLAGESSDPKLGSIFEVRLRSNLYHVEPTVVTFRGRRGVPREGGSGEEIDAVSMQKINGLDHRIIYDIPATHFSMGGNSFILLSDITLAVMDRIRVQGVEIPPSPTTDFYQGYKDLIRGILEERGRDVYELKPLKSGRYLLD